MDRLERLLNLVAALLDTERSLTAEELGTRVPGYPTPKTPTFKRAFERDKATLRAMGIPLDVVELQPGNPETPIGYRIRPDRYELPDPGLDAEELAALHLAATQVRLEGGDATAAIWKLGGVPGDVPLAETAALPGSAHLSTLFAALASRATVEFSYRGSARSVDPWRIEFRNRSWYLVGWDHDRSGRRTFRLDRVDGVVETGPAGAFEVPQSTDPVATHPWQVGDEDPIDVTVLVDADQAPWAVADSDATPVWRDNGDVELTLRVTNRAGLRSWVLGFLDRAEILGPASERDALLAWIDA
ncbi:MAG: helix-turn-helix transcriptional regulator [Acidimicrobiales bacterium]